MAILEIINRKKKIVVQPGQSLLNILLYEGQPIHTICGGHAKCGCCRIIIEAGSEGLSPVRPQELQRLGSELIAAGWRLACQTYALRDCTVYLPEGEELDAYCSKKR